MIHYLRHVQISHLDAGKCDIVLSPFLLIAICCETDKYTSNNSDFASTATPMSPRHRAGDRVRYSQNSFGCLYKISLIFVLFTEAWRSQLKRLAILASLPTCR
jgi:hypothetical protein